MKSLQILACCCLAPLIGAAGAQTVGIVKYCSLYSESPAMRNRSAESAIAPQVSRTASTLMSLPMGPL